MDPNATLNVTGINIENRRENQADRSSSTVSKLERLSPTEKTTIVGPSNRTSALVAERIASPRGSAALGN
jgi:hypothetical protein